MREPNVGCTGAVDPNHQCHHQSPQPKQLSWTTRQETRGPIDLKGSLNPHVRSLRPACPGERYLAQAPPVKLRQEQKQRMRDAATTQAYHRAGASKITVLAMKQALHPHLTKPLQLAWFLYLPKNHLSLAISIRT